MTSAETKHPRLLILSAYRSDSHGVWVDWLTQHLEADWKVLELPGRYFRWRIRGNPLSWLDALPDILCDWSPDRILATSMVDLSTLRGLFPELVTVPVSYYFHENQFAYPLGDNQHASIDPQMVQMYGALCADELIFNSLYNQNTFLEGVDALLRRLPDHRPKTLSHRLKPLCRWMPVPVEPVLNDVVIEKRMQGSQPPLIVWNHRWEYDKCPDDFLAVIERLASRHVPFRLALFGGGAQEKHPAFLSLKQQFGSHIVAAGFLPRQVYKHWLRQADIVFSSACHEFQGVAVLEAVSAGTWPLVPDDLCYREQYPDEYRYPLKDLSAATDRLVTLLALRQNLSVRSSRSGVLAASISAWLAPSCGELWRRWLLQTGECAVSVEIPAIS